jgi:hypothetical protein
VVPQDEGVHEGQVSEVVQNFSVPLGGLGFHPMIKIYLFYINKLRKKKTKIAGDGQKRKKIC